MIKKPLTLSIIIPVYNEENHIAACLDSIRAQTHQPTEVILVDNNCTDSTLKIAKTYKFVKIVKEPKQGVVWARNKGFNSAKGQIIGRIDADTLLPKDWVRRVYEYYRNPENQNSAISGGCYFYNIRLPYFWGWMQGHIAFSVNRMLLGHYITFGSNMAFPRQLWQNVQPNVCLRNDIHEDLDLGIHLHRLGYKIHYEDSLKVGVKMRRVMTDSQELWQNLIMWPQTLRVHGRWTWVFGWLGAVLAYCSYPLGPLMEWTARLFGKDPLQQ